MAKLSIKPGSTDVTVYVLLQDATSLVGAGKTGLSYWSGHKCYYVRTRGTSTAIVLTAGNALVNGNHVDGTFLEVSQPNMPGVYRLDLPDAVCAAGARSAVVLISGLAGIVPVALEIDLSSDANVEYWKGAAAPAMTGDAYATAIAIKTKTDNLPASPAAVGSEMALTVAYDAAKTAAAQASVDDLASDVADWLDELEAALAVVDANVDAIFQDTRTTLPALISAGTGTGLYSETITVNDGDGLPVDGVLVQVATDSAFSNVVRSGYTDNLGQVTLNFDATGTYYGRAEISGYGVSEFVVEVTE